MAGIRIDELDQTILQSRDHVVPAMKDGMTVQLSVGQILSRLLRDDLAGKLFAEDIAFDPGTGGPLVAEDVQAAIEEMLAQLVGTFPQTLTGPKQAQARANIGLPPPDPGEMAAGTETAPRAMSPADIREGVALSKMWESGEQVITTGGTLTLAHTLGVKPAIVMATVVCKVAESSYTVGDEIDFGNMFFTNASPFSQGVVLKSDSAAIGVQFSDVGTEIPSLWWGSGGSANLTNTNWRLIVRAFA